MQKSLLEYKKKGDTMKKLIAVVLVGLLLGNNVHAFDKENPGNWEIRVPSNINTVKDYERYRKAKKIAVILGLVGLAGSVYLHSKGSSLRRRASGIDTDEDVLVSDGNGGFYYPLIQSELERKRNLYDKGNAFRTAGTILGVASITCLIFSFSIQF